MRAEGLGLSFRLAEVGAQGLGVEAGRTSSVLVNWVIRPPVQVQAGFTFGFSPGMEGTSSETQLQGLRFAILGLGIGDELALHKPLGLGT